MIISASRRTDIPAFFGEWFMKRLKEGYVLVKNPYNISYLSKILLQPETVDCIVFWTKNPKSFIKHLKSIDNLGYAYYFLFTLNPYTSYLETNVPYLKELIDTYKLLSDKIGSQKVVWRYDPIIITKEFTLNYHVKKFSFLCSKLSSYTHTCITSFITMYSKCKKNLSELNIDYLSDDKKLNILIELKNITNSYNIELKICATSLTGSGNIFQHAKCIDNNLIENIIDTNLKIKKDKNQRETCLCVESIDIGTYNTCLHKCRYCYANYSFSSVDKNIKLHNQDSPLLIGNISDNENIIQRKINSNKTLI